ncbi:MAG: adenine deaminase [Archaeoglobaceae archaeon]
MSSRIAELKELLAVARGEKRAQLVLKRAEIVNVISEEIEVADIAVHRGVIVGVGSYSGVEEVDCRNLIAVPGLVDAHTHVEMSMLSLTEFARLVVPRGTTCVVADPHEIANVLGVEGVKLLIEESRHVPLRFYCLAPSCVPSSPLETPGAKLGVEEVKELMELEEVIGLAEVMNYPGTVEGDEELLAKIAASRGVVDGHCPGLRGERLNAYIVAGAMSDHEVSGLEEAKEKLRRGMRIMIREGSAARNLRILKELIPHRNVMLVTDGDRTPLDLLNEGYLDHVFRRAVEEGVDEIHALQAVTLNPAEYFRLNCGAIAPGRLADIVLLKNLRRFEVEAVFVDGARVTSFERRFEYPEFAKKTFRLARKVTPEDLQLGSGLARIIRVIDGEIITGEDREYVEGIDVERDVLKIAVVERHRATGNVGKAYVRGFGLKRGAVAQSIAHDAHNIVCVGASDDDMCTAINRVAELQGGIVVVDGFVKAELPLKIAGLMSDEKAEVVAERLRRIYREIGELGCKLRDPIMTLSFVALPVIPKLKVTDLGLVDVESFEVVDPLL